MKASNIKMANVVICIALLMVIPTPNVSGLPTGAPLAACDNGLLPIHGGNTVSSSPLPFVVDITDIRGQTYIPNQLYRIGLNGLSSNQAFRGFLIQARTVATNSATGEFVRGDSLSIPQCSGNSAATHTESSGKFSVVLWWRAPPPGTGAILFRFTFVERFSLFWHNVTGPIFEGTSSFTSFPTSTSSRFFPTSTRVFSTSTTTRIFPTSTTRFFSTSFPTSTSTRFFSTSFPTSTSTRFFSTSFPTSTSTRFFSTSFPTSTSTRFFSTSFFTSTSTRFFPTPTTSTVIPTSTPTGPPTSCAQLTGYPPCSPEVCYGKDSLKRCSITVDTCTERCQVTICGACFYINRPASNKQCSHRSYCKDFNCLLQWINCSYKKSVQSQFICMIAAAADTLETGGLKLPYGKGGLASDLFTIL